MNVQVGQRWKYTSPNKGGYQYILELSENFFSIIAPLKSNL